MQATATLGWALLPLVFTFGTPRTQHTPNAGRVNRSRSTCNALVSDAPSVMSTNSPGKVPAATGGTLSDGTYVLSSMTVYTAMPFPGIMVSSMMQVSGNTIQQVANMNGEEKRFTTSFTIAGASIAMMDTCPTRKSGNYTFSATPTELRMYLTSPLGKIEQTYTKR
jgi:hypothetical protein